MRDEESKQKRKDELVSFTLSPCAYFEEGRAFIPHPSSFILAFLALHRGKEFRVRLRLLESLQHDFHLLDWRQRIQNTSHHPDTIQVFLADKQLFLARS